MIIFAELMKTSALYSQYVIDGAVMEKTPAQVLDAVCNERHPEPGESYDSIVDESMDPVIGKAVLDSACLDEYLASVMEGDENLDPACSDSYSRFHAASALCASLWREGHFCLEDLAMNVEWSWDTAPVGAASAFYRSVQALTEYLDSLDIRLSSYGVDEVGGSFGLSSSVSLSPEADSDVFMTDGRMCPSVMVPDTQSWLVYVPFDTCDFRLGGSLLASRLRTGLGTEPQINDPDYFMDCYEVLRELVEDGVVIAATEIPRGGMMKALKTMLGAGVGLSVDISDIMNSYEEQNALRVLFAEVPGVLIQIRDADFDYLDAELLLQDVAFFPLGHPTLEDGELRVKSSRKTGIQRILESLMLNAEGED